MLTSCTGRELRQIRPVVTEYLMTVYVVWMSICMGGVLDQLVAFGSYEDHHNIGN